MAELARKGNHLVVVRGSRHHHAREAEGEEVVLERGRGGRGGVRRHQDHRGAVKQGGEGVGVVFLCRVAFPGVINETDMTSKADVAGGVGGARVDDNYFIGNVF